ncbi:LacI family transcriptional regulator [Pseudoroseicyclus tamaricis]|uniref:LacI family transcriptional regulator n=1 Tax=Pseudoroseicyclus tamaricis TaxID=2705421 RepID=UPI001F3001A6|nr:LacI family transcriptional regulator [Pseudoroseicyclus tamaricis]
MRTIADLSGLAVPTVSRALNDAPDIGAGTKQLVRRIADEIGYIPNRAGVRLRTGRTNVIALVLSTEQEIMNHTARLITSISGALQGSPFHLIVSPFLGEQDLMKPIRYLVETRSADALIFNMIEPEDRRVAYLMERGFPFATHGRTIWSDRHAYWDFDNDAFARIAVTRLAERGRRHMLLIAPPQHQNYAKLMVAGARAEAAARGGTMLVADTVTSDSESAPIRAFVARALAEEPRIDGIICGSPTAAMASVAALEGAGRRMAHDIDVVAKEAIPFLTLFRDSMLVIDEDVRAAGEFLARAAMKAVREPDAPPMQGLEIPTGESFTSA